MELNERVQEENAKSTNRMETFISSKRHIFNQILLVCGASFGYLTVGMSLGWPNILHRTQDGSTIYDDTPIHFSSVDMDTAASVFFGGSMPGFFFAGWIVGIIGRKWSMLASGIPGILGNLLISTALNVYMVFIGRFLDGITFGMMIITIRSYVAEISDPESRGSSCIAVNIAMQVGNIIILIFGAFLPWYYASLLTCGTTVIYLMIVPLLPESPTYLLIHNKDTVALAILSSLRKPGSNLQEEISLLKRMNHVGDDSKAGFRGLLRSEIVKKLISLFGLFVCCNFSGVQVMKANTLRMLESSNLKMKGNLDAILVITLILVGNLTMMLFIDRLGRRRCLIFSLFSVSLSYFCLGAYHFMNITPREFGYPEASNSTHIYESSNSMSEATAQSWIPLACLLTVAFGQSFGAGPIPYLLTQENFPTNIRSQASSICAAMSGLLSLIALQLFSPLQVMFSIGGVYVFFAVWATIGIPYVFFLIHETRGERVG